MFDTQIAATAAGGDTHADFMARDHRDPGSDRGAIIQAIRARARDLSELLKEIQLRIDAQHQHATATADVDEMQRLQDADPYRWLADAKHALQSGMMFAERSVEQPPEF